jgi:hypothetical protein
MLVIVYFAHRRRMDCLGLGGVVFVGRSGFVWGSMPSLVCRDNYGLGGVILVFIVKSNLGGGLDRVFWEEEEGGGVRSRSEAAQTSLRTGKRTILHVHTIQKLLESSYGTLLFITAVPIISKDMWIHAPIFVSARTIERHHLPQ